MAEKIEVSQRPIGTLEEVQKIGKSPRMVACCHPQTDSVKGCNRWGRCQSQEEFAPWREKKPGFKGPCNCGVLLISGDTGAADVRVMACHEFLGYPWEVMQNADKTGDVVELIALEGEPITVRYTDREHPRPEPGCNECAKGTCVKRVDREQEIVVPKFPRPKEAAASLAFGEKMRKKMLRKLEERRRLRALNSKKRDFDYAEVDEGELREQAKAQAK